MKVVVFTANTGGGHRRTAMTIKTYIEENMPNSHVIIIDAIREVNRLVDKTVCGSYLFMAKNTPKLYGLIYNQTQKEKLDISKPLSFIASNRLLNTLRLFQPDVIISTHPFAAEMVSWLKRKGKVSCPVITVMTDYGPHRAYITRYIDAYIVPADECINPMVEFGAEKDRIHPYGIPIPPIFHSISDEERNETAGELGLINKPGVPVLLLMAGSFGVSSVLDVYDSLMESDEQFELVVITGKNDRLYKSFSKRIKHATKTVHLLYFTDKVHKYMQCADLIITKPGGLTVSEAINCDLPMAVYNAIPGQEEDNANFLVKKGIAVKIDDCENARDIIDPLLSNLERLKTMKQQAIALDISNSLPNILKLSQTLSGDKVEELEEEYEAEYGVYLDNSATTQVSLNAANKAFEIMTKNYGNPSSVHEMGIMAEHELDVARKAIADKVGAKPDEITFTSCGTESNNTAIFGAVEAKKRYGNKIVTTAIEHASVARCMDELEKQGYEVVRLQPDRYGNITEEQIFDAVDEKTILVSIMLVNNELGTILPVEAAAKAIKRKKSPALLHTDAVQAFGKMVIKAKSLGVDLISMSGHKVYAPKGVGALYIKQGVRIPARQLGGGQEKKMRSGTEAMPAICAFGQAVKDLPRPEEYLLRMQGIADYLRECLSEIDGITFNSPENALPYVVNFSTNKIKTETMINYLSHRGIYVSGGSACSKGHESSVLGAIGASRREIESSIRASFSIDTTEMEIDALVQGIKDGMEELVSF